MNSSIVPWGWQRSVNPHHFAYGAMHCYVLGVGAVATGYLYSLVPDGSNGARSAEEAEKQKSSFALQPHRTEVFHLSD